MQHEKYDGYKSTFGQVDVPTTHWNKGWFVCLAIACCLVGAACFGTVGRQEYAQHREAVAAQAKVLAASQAEAVQKLMTVFPKYHKAVKGMSNYLFTGAGTSAWNGTYVQNGTLNGYPAYELDPSHWAVYSSAASSYVTSSSGTVAPSLPSAAYSHPGATMAGTWNNVGSTGASPAPTVTASVGPVYASASIDSTGLTLTTPYTYSGSDTPLLAPGTPTLTSSVRGAISVGSGTVSGDSIIYSILETAYKTACETFTVSGAAGITTDSASPTPNGNDAFTTQAVTNGSTQVPFPYYDSITGATVATDGKSVVFPITEAIPYTPYVPYLGGTAVTGFSVKVNGKTYAVEVGSISGSNVTIPLLGVILKGDNVLGTGGYTISDSQSTPASLFAFTDVFVKNNSTVTPTLQTPAVMYGGQLGNLKQGDQLIQPSPVSVQSLTDGATVTWDVSDAQVSKAALALTGNHTLVIVNAKSGQEGILGIANSSSHTLTLPTNSLTVSGNPITIGTVDALRFYFDGTDFWWSHQTDTALAAVELLTNKATDFSTINNTLYPTVEAVQNQIIASVAGLLDYRGGYDTSGNAYPSSGGSGLAGVIAKGDFWICSVAGTLNSISVTVGSLIIAKVDLPSTTDANWDVVPVVTSGGASTLAGLSDVTITSQSTGQVLTWNGTKWVNSTPSGGGGGSVTPTQLLNAIWFYGA